MTQLRLISQNPESTLVSEFKRDDKRERSYQSEAALALRCDLLSIIVSLLIGNILSAILSLMYRQAIASGKIDIFYS